MFQTTGIGIYVFKEGNRPDVNAHLLCKVSFLKKGQIII